MLYTFCSQGEWDRASGAINRAYTLAISVSDGSTMSNPYSSFCDDFYLNVRLGSQLNLPHQRETLLHFFERIQKEFPRMTRFRKSDNGDLNLAEDRSSQN